MMGERGKEEKRINTEGEMVEWYLTWWDMSFGAASWEIYTGKPDAPVDGNKEPYTLADWELHQHTL